MKRRQLLAGVGVLAAGGASALGTGAFTPAQANRSVGVSVANEDQGYLALTPTTEENATFVNQDSSANNELSVDINDATGTVDDGDGVGLDSTYEFDSVFQIENQGTQEVEVSITTLSDGDFDPSASGLTVEFYDGTDSNSSLDPSDSPVTLGTGNSTDIGMKIETEDPDIEDFDADATVSADAT